ncbi:MAG: SemiSWEET family sugar transporter [Nanobdellota archaeon]
MIEIIGWVAAIFTGTQFFPQVYKTFATKSAKDLSMATFTVVIATTILWMIYAIGIDNLIIFVTNALLFISGTALLAMKLSYK